MRVLLTRHYKTLGNASEQILGWGDSPHVEGWQRDMEFVVERLRRHHIVPDAIYSSSLKRAQTTAGFYASLLGINQVFARPELNEVNYGELHKKKKKWVAEHYPLHKKDPDFVYPGGECFREMQRRSVEYLASLAARDPQQTILIVGHSGIIRGFVSHFLRLNYAEHLSHAVPHRYIGDFRFAGSTCNRYDELGKASGFVRDGVIKVPYSPRAAGSPKASAEPRPYPEPAARPADSL